MTKSDETIRRHRFTGISVRPDTARKLAELKKLTRIPACDLIDILATRELLALRQSQRASVNALLAASEMLTGEVIYKNGSGV